MEWGIEMNVAKKLEEINNATVKEKKSKVEKMQTKCGRVIEQFLAECKQKSKSTEINYRGDLNRFFNMVYDGRTIHTITFEELDCLDYEILTQYKDNGFEDLANTTANRHISSIKALMRYLKARNCLESDIAYLDLVSLLPSRPQRIEGMPRNVVLRYIGEAGREKFNAEVKQALIMAAADTALRLEDYLELEWSDFSPQEDGVVISGYGKNNKRWIEKITYDFYNEEILPLKQNQEYGEKRVFAPLNRKNVTDMMTRFKTTLGYEDRSYSFHSLKKTGVEFAYRLTNDIMEAKKKGKHENIQTTLIYLEEANYGITGMFSLGVHDAKLYEKVSHEELLKAVGELNADTIHLLNIKIKSLQKEKDGENV